MRRTAVEMVAVGFLLAPRTDPGVRC